jgi:flagellar assembly protein FliH
MTSPVIPKEKLSAYERWEMASFGDDRPSAQHQSRSQAERARQQAADLAKLSEDARQQGHAEGFEQGRKAGLEAGRTDAAHEIARLRAMSQNFVTEIARVDETVADEMLTLALDLSKAMLKTALKVRPELVLPVVSEAIRYLPSVQQPALLVLNPQDAEIVRAHMADELDKAGWRVTEDVRMEPGGCRVETASNQIDANIDARWQRIAEALGRQSDWLE